VVFQPFLDQSGQQPARGRGFLVSLALHGVVALLTWLLCGRMGSADAPTRAIGQDAVSVHLASFPRQRVGPEAPAPATERPKRAGSWSSASRRAQGHPAAVVATEPAPQPSAALATEDEGEAQPGTPDESADPGGTQAGGSPADGSFGAAGGGSRPVRRRQVQLFGRVVGGNRPEAIGAQGLPYAPLKETTALRTYDVFPPLPASQWDGDRPYLVVLDVCVSREGQVSDVGLIRPASRIFDPVVLEAVRTWRYKPRLVDGQAQAFCHVVAIKYEQL
jgi:TonB family protein